MRDYTLTTATKRHQMISLMLLLVAILSGCASEKTETEVPVTPVVIEKPQEPESMSLAFACIPSVSNAGTRLSTDIVQSGTSYRPINTNDIHFVALKKNESSAITSVANSEVDKQESADKTNARYYHFSYCDMPQGTNGCLVYAKAEDVAQATAMTTKAHNGCLKESSYLSNYVNSTDQISFEPVSIYDDATVDEDGFYADAKILANALTDIANTTTEEGNSWRSLNEQKMKPLLANFTNNGYDLPGSAASVKKWIESLKKAATNLGSQGDGTPAEKIRQLIIKKAGDYLNSEKQNHILSLNYPQNINLPDGAAVLRWAKKPNSDEYAFIPQLQTTTLDDINSITRFAYPPALYYFVESGIKTSNSKVIFDGDGEQSNYYKYDASWSDVLTRFTNGSEITTSTKTIAIADPLQYAVARLLLKVKVDDTADNTKLKCNGDNTIDYNDGSGTDYFRLTGVIVGGQRMVGYDFKPINNSDMDVKFVYDSQIADNFYLKKSSTDEFNTLVLQSWGGENVNVILEFEYVGKLNQEGKQEAPEFRCLNGWVYPGTRFYLVGEIDLSKATAGDTGSEGRVFTQDFTTTIQMTVSSLEKAYNVLPSIISKNLEIGVETTPQWKAAKPSSIIME